MQKKLQTGAQSFTDDAVFIAQKTTKNLRADGFGSNVADRSAFDSAIAQDRLSAPYTVRRYTAAAGSTGNRIYAPFDHFDTTAEGFWVGGSATIYRLDGTISHVRTSEIVGHAASDWNTQTPFEGSSHVHQFSTVHRPSANQWIACRAYDAAGNVGPVSNAVQITTPATWANAGSATASSGKTLTGDTTGALGAPVISVATGWPSADTATVTIETAASGSPEGYVFLISDHDPADHLGNYIDLADDGGASVAVDDMVLVSIKDETPSRPKNLSNRIWRTNNQGPDPAVGLLAHGTWDSDASGKTWRFQSHSGGGYTGHQSEYLEVTMADGVSDQLLFFFACGATATTNDRTAYRVLQPGVTYRVEIWARSDAARTIWPSLKLQDGQVITVTKINDVTTNISFSYADRQNKIAWPLTTSWSRLSFEFEVDEEDTTSGLGWFDCPLSGPARFDFSDFVIRHADAPTGRLTQRQLARLQAEQPLFIRDHRLVKTQVWGRGYDLRRLIVNLLHDSLANTVQAGIPQVWLQPEFHLPAAEWLGLAEYLFAPAGAGQWASLRASLGRTSPWGDAFDRILFELSNETWNTLSEFFNFPNLSAEWYGKWQERVIGILKTSPHWSSEVNDKVEFVIGGWVATGYGEAAAEYSPSTKWVTYAPYLGGWESGEGTVVEGPAGYQSALFAGPTRALNLMGTYLSRTAPVATARGVPISIGSYETAMGFNLPGPSVDQSDLDRAAKSKAAAAGLMAKWLEEFRAGFEFQAHFLLNEGQVWSSHQYEHVGNEAYPDWQWASLWNRLGCTRMLGTYEIKNPVRAVTVATTPYSDAPEVGCFIASDGAAKRIVALINRNLPWDVIDSGDPLYDAADDGVRTVRVLVPWASGALTRYHMPGAYNAQNYEPSPTFASLSIASEALGAHTGPLVRTMPPATLELFVFEGVA